MKHLFRHNLFCDWWGPPLLSLKVRLKKFQKFKDKKWRLMGLGSWASSSPPKWFSVFLRTAPADWPALADNDWLAGWRWLTMVISPTIDYQLEIIVWCKNYQCTELGRRDIFCDHLTPRKCEQVVAVTLSLNIVSKLDFNSEGQIYDEFLVPQKT